jgi:hypothetical protein
MIADCNSHQNSVAKLNHDDDSQTTMGKHIAVLHTILFRFHSKAVLYTLQWHTVAATLYILSKDQLEINVRVEREVVDVVVSIVIPVANFPTSLCS